MWGLNNQTRFSAERTFVAVPPEEQQPVCLVPIYFGSPAVSSLRYDCDLVRTKLSTDVVLHAHAHAVGERATKSVDVACRVGALTKALRVVGERTWCKAKCK